MSSYTQTASGGQRRGGMASVPITGFTLLVNADITYAVAGGDLRVSWSNPEPAAQWFQLYQDRQLMGAGRERAMNVPPPSQRVNFSVAAVPAAMANVDFSDRITSIPRQEIVLGWYGGRYLGEEIAGFNVYMGDTPGDLPDEARVLATVPVYAGNQPLDGYGRGGYGRGGYGSAATHYEWTSPPMAPGVWHCEVKSVDLFGNESTSVATVTVSVSGPPEPPALFPDHTRLHYVYSPSTHAVTLDWNPSPTGA